MGRIILASQSPRRRELLRQMGITRFDILPAKGEEDMTEQVTPAALAEHLALAKAKEVAAKAEQDAVVIAADTIVVQGGRVLGKPHSEQAAFEMLSALSGATHQVYTGVAVIRGEQVQVCHECTDVTFRPLSDGEISAYIATRECMDKAGAYGIQGRGALLVEGIRGDYFNVVGLPVCRLGTVLKEFGIDTL